jgi:hypothetical protein
MRMSKYWRVISTLLLAAIFTGMPYLVWYEMQVCWFASRHALLFAAIVAVIAVATLAIARASALSALLLGLYFLMSGLYSLKLIDVYLALTYEEQAYSYSIGFSHLIARTFIGEFGCVVPRAETVILGALPSYYLTLSITCFGFGFLRALANRIGFGAGR